MKIFIATGSPMSDLLECLTDRLGHRVFLSQAILPGSRVAPWMNKSAPPRQAPADDRTPVELKTRRAFRQFLINALALQFSKAIIVVTPVQPTMLWQIGWAQASGKPAYILNRSGEVLDNCLSACSWIPPEALSDYLASEFPASKAKSSTPQDISVDNRIACPLCFDQNGGEDCFLCDSQRSLDADLLTSFPEATQVQACKDYDWALLQKTIL